MNGELTKKTIYSIIFVGLVGILSEAVQAKIKHFDFLAEVKMTYFDSNNLWDKTSTIIRPSGSAEYDDVNSYMTTDIKLGLKAFLQADVYGLVEFQKRDRLWATHNDTFNAERFQTAGEILGHPDPRGSRVYTGFKLTKGHLRWENLAHGKLNLTFGRQYLSGTDWPDPSRMDLVLNMTTDGLRFDYKFGKFDAMFFKSKINDSTAREYDTAGGLTWETRYENRDFDAFGFVVKSDRLFEDQFLKFYLLNATLNDPTVTNPQGRLESRYDTRYIFGGRAQGMISPRIGYQVELALLRGEKFVGRYTYTHPTTFSPVTVDYYNKAGRAAMAYILGVDYRRFIKLGKLKLLAQYIGGTGDDSSTAVDEGFTALNDEFHSRARGYDHQGWGEIYKATPYKPNRYGGGTEPDGRTVERGISNYPASIINLGLNYEFIKKFKGLSAGINWFMFTNISPDGVVITDPDTNQRRRTYDLGKEIDFYVKYTYKYFSTFRIVYGIFIPGDTYITGKDTQTGKVLGKDIATMFKFEAILYSY